MARQGGVARQDGWVGDGADRMGVSRQSRCVQSGCVWSDRVRVTQEKSGNSGCGQAEWVWVDGLGVASHYNWCFQIVFV